VKKREPQITAVSRRLGDEERTGVREALSATQRLFEAARGRLRDRLLAPGQGRLSAQRLEERQHGAHALAHLAAEIEAARQLVEWAERSDGALERRIAEVFAGDLVRSLRGGVTLGPCESVPLADLELGEDDVAKTIATRAVVKWTNEVASAAARARLAAEAREAGHSGDLTTGSPAMDDELYASMRQEMRRFAEREVAPIAQGIHRDDALVPLELIERMGALGVFSMTIPESFGGQGFGKVAMCVVTEELSRGSLAVGSLGTRAEIAAELILSSGTEVQKATWLPRIASGEVLPAAVFTEPNHGSDLAHITARAERAADGGWKFDGQKTWATHASRADLMTVLLRTEPGEKGYEGLSMFLAPKRRGDDASDFPDPGLAGTEIPVIGYRGMKEYELSFDGFRVGPEALLGGARGAGFKQLMSTFEAARIQTAARGVGVAQAALDQASTYAHDRVQFGAPIERFPRVAGKLGRMICLVMAARQLTYFAARARDSGKRCDLEAGMAKLLATRAAWECADACVQIHGGQGYAEESVASRLLLDARVLSIFEGSNEVQAQVVARRLLEDGPGAGQTVVVR